MKNPVRDPRLSFGELELTFLTFHFSCLPSKRSFGSCPRDDPILRLRREAKSKQSLFRISENIRHGKTCMAPG